MISCSLGRAKCLAGLSGTYDEDMRSLIVVLTACREILNGIFVMTHIVKENVTSPHR